MRRREKRRRSPVTEQGPSIQHHESPPTGSPGVAIVILNYNGWQYTAECLESLGHLDYPNWWVVLVDNGSSDDSVERIRAWARGEVRVESPYVREPGWPKPVPMVEYDGEPAGSGDVEKDEARLVLIRLPENRGFAAGNNVAIRYALRRGADWTWLLNNDTVAAPDSLREMVRAGESDPRIGVVGCKLLYYDRPDVIQAAGGGRFYFWLGISRNYGFKQRDGAAWQRPFEPHYVSGASMLVRAAAWLRVGFLDEQFFFYTEEVDWQLRARAFGVRSVYAPRAIVYHREKATAGASGWAEYHSTRSNILLCRKHCGHSLLIAIPMTLARAGRKVVRGRAEEAVAVLQGLVAGLRSPDERPVP